MSPEPAKSNAPDGGDKLYWEIEKLRAETESLRRPAYLSPTTLFSAVTVFAALLGAGIQFRPIRFGRRMLLSKKSRIVLVRRSFSETLHSIRVTLRISKKRGPRSQVSFRRCKVSAT